MPTIRTDFKTLEQWAKGEDEEPQLIFWVDKKTNVPDEPVYVDLHRYLPPHGENDSSTYLVANSLRVDPNGKQYISQQSPTSPFGWRSEMKKVMASLRMTLKRDANGALVLDENGRPFIEDANVNYNRDEVRMGLAPGWHITKWRINLTKMEGEADLIFKDTITWRKEGVGEVTTSHGWRIYR